jgi:anti-sigma-K factor RskA
MIDEPLDEQASLYALGALPPEEAAAFEAQMAVNDELRRHVDALTDAVAQIAYAAPARALPPHLEASILEQIRGAKITPITSAPRRANWIPWAIAACLAIACLVTFADRQRVAAELTQARSDNTETQSQLAALATDKERAEQQLAELRQREADARVQMATLADAREKAETRIKEIEARDELTKVQVATLTSKLPDAPEATAAVVWDPERQRGVLNTANMPPNATNRDYQLWVVDPRYENPVDAGVFTVEKAGGTKYFFTPKSRITSATAFAISLERKGGVPKAEGPIVLAGK